MEKFNLRKSLLLFIASTILLTSNFYDNRWGVIEPGFYKYWQDIFEALVVGRLTKSQHEGIFSAGGLLVVGGAEEEDVLSNRNIARQYDAYARGENFDAYWTYTSHPAFGVIFYSIFDKFTEFPPGINLAIFRASVSLVTAAVLALLLVWLEFEFGIPTFILSLIFFSFSPWLILISGNLYWQAWSLYLPFASSIIINIYCSRRGAYPKGMITTVIFLAVLTKILFSGFEFISPVLVSLTVPFVYYSVKQKWELDTFVYRFVHITLAAIGGTIAGLFVLFVQISYGTGSSRAGIESIVEALNRRSVLGDPGKVPELYAGALSANFWQVLERYINGPALAFDRNFTGFFYAAGIDFNVLLAAFAFFSLVLAGLILRRKDLPSYRRDLALLLTTWFSILAPLSWFLLFKAHAYIHTNLDHFVWQLPFTIFGVAIVGVTISRLFTLLRDGKF